MFCPQCGNQLADNARFCSNCGTQIEGQPAAAQPAAAQPAAAQPTQPVSAEYAQPTAAQPTQPAGTTPSLGYGDSSQTLYGPPPVPPRAQGGGYAPPPQSGGKSRTPLMIALVVAIVIIAVLVFVMATGVLQGSSSTASSSQTTSQAASQQASTASADAPSAEASAASAASADATASSAASEPSAGNTASTDATGASGESPSAAAASSAAANSAAASGTAVGTDTSTANSRDEALQKAKDAAWDKGQQVFEGQLRILSASELASMQGAPEAGYAEDGEYAVVFFDQPITVYGMSGDGSGGRSQTASMLGVAEYSSYDSFVSEFGDLDSWRPYDGQTVTVAAAQEDIWFPSDVRLPLGEPTAKTCELLG